MVTSVDVTVPCYGYGRFLKQCVESILAQTGVSVRVLVLDDASPDNTAEVATELERLSDRVEFRRHAANKGHITTYNEGIEWASADLFLLLSADDYLLPGALSRAAELMRRNPDTSFVFGNAFQLREDGSTIGIERLGYARNIKTTTMDGSEFIRISQARNIVLTPTAVVRTVAQKRVGGYSPHLPHSGDMAMWLRLAAEGPVGFVNEYQAVYRMHSLNMSRSYASLRLPDVEQRRAAIEHFLELSGNRMRDGAHLRDMLFRSLGREAICEASGALDDGNIDLSQQLSRIALEVHPRVRSSIPFMKLACKRIIGPKAWRALRSVVVKGL